MSYQIILDFWRLDLLTSAYHTTAQTQQMTDDDHNGGGVLMLCEDMFFVYLKI